MYIIHQVESGEMYFIHQVESVDILRNVNSGEEITCMFQNINEAYSVLANPESRRQYDWKIGLRKPGSTGDYDFYYDEVENNILVMIENTFTKINTNSLMVVVPVKEWTAACNKTYKQNFVELS